MALERKQSRILPVSRVKDVRQHIAEIATALDAAKDAEVTAMASGRDALRLAQEAGQELRVRDNQQSASDGPVTDRPRVRAPRRAVASRNRGGARA